MKLIKIESLSSLKRTFFIYNEGDNLTGTHKDRIAEAHVRDCLNKGLSHITIASCGNYGASIATYAASKNIKATVFIPSLFDSPRIREIENQGASVMRLPLSYEACVEKSREFARENHFYDANPGGVNSQFQIDVYADMAKEISSLLSSSLSLSALSVSVSNGTTLAGLYRGVASSVKIIGGTTQQNPIFTSFFKKLPVPEVLNESDLRESSINEPLINWNSLDGLEALNALSHSDGRIYAATDHELLSVQELLLKEGISAHPAGCAGVFGMMRFMEETSEGLFDQAYVSVVTSRDYA